MLIQRHRDKPPVIFYPLIAKVILTFQNHLTQLVSPQHSYVVMQYAVIMQFNAKVHFYINT